MSPAAALIAVANGGGKMWLDANHNLRLKVPPPPDPDLIGVVRDNKAKLTVLLRHSFIIIRSELVSNEPLFWANGEADRVALIEAGVEDGVIYTRQELESLVRSVSCPTELCAIHNAKATFAGRLSG